mgnify:CR=1 FL=1
MIIADQHLRRYFLRHGADHVEKLGSVFARDDFQSQQLPVMIIDHHGDPDALVGLAELTARNNDARGMLLVGKAALNRGLPFDHYAYPVTGIPSFKQIGPEVEPSVVYSIARQESAFNPAVVSPARLQT